MPGDVTKLLIAHRTGEKSALGRLVPLVYADLRRLARAQMRGRRPGASLDTGALVHEAYAKLVDADRASWTDRGHFLAVAAIAMRQIVVDHARARARQKRGDGNAPVTFDDAADPSARDLELALAVNEALEKLGASNPRLVQVVECRFFAGLNEQETAAALDLSVRTVQREWFKARAWLRDALAPAARPDAQA